MYYLFLLMLNSKKLISISLASALVLSLPLNSLAIGVNDTSNYVTSSDYNSKIAELETRIADLEANQNTTDVNTALQEYFNDDATSPIVAGDYITITDNNGKKMISASSKPTTITAGDQHIEVTKNETDSDITFTLRQKSNSFRLNLSGPASSSDFVYYTKNAVPDSVTDAWVSGPGSFNLAKLKVDDPLYSGATGTLNGTYNVHFTSNFVSAEIYDNNGLYAVAYTPTADFRSLTNLAFFPVPTTNGNPALNYNSEDLNLTASAGWSVTPIVAKKVSVQKLVFIVLTARYQATDEITNNLNGIDQLKIGTVDIGAELYATARLYFNGTWCTSFATIYDNSIYIGIPNCSRVKPRADFTFVCLIPA